MTAKRDLVAVPLSQREANRFIEEHHRHHKRVQGDRFRVGCVIDGALVGVITVGNPVSRLLCDGYTVEVTRCCTDGSPDVCSFLYSRAARIAKEMGFKKIITYILAHESGTSLKASGWHCEVERCGGGTWSRPSRPREEQTITMFGVEDKYPTEEKQRWCRDLGRRER